MTIIIIPLPPTTLHPFQSMSSRTYLKLACDAYRDAAKTPLLVSARVDLDTITSSSSLIPITTRWSQSNLSTNQKVTFNKQVIVSGNNLCVEHESVGVVESGREMFTTRGEVVALVRQAANKEDCQNIELWSRDKGMQATFNMKEVDVHGRIYTDMEFGTLELSEDKKSLIYIAEKKKEKNFPFLTQGEVKDGSKVGLVKLGGLNYLLEYFFNAICFLDPFKAI